MEAHRNRSATKNEHDTGPGVTLALPLCHRLSFWRVSPATGGAFFAVRSPGRINSHLRLLRRIFAHHRSASLALPVTESVVLPPMCGEAS